MTTSSNKNYKIKFPKAINDGSIAHYTPRPHNSASTQNPQASSASTALRGPPTAKPSQKNTHTHIKIEICKGYMQWVNHPTVCLLSVAVAPRLICMLHPTYRFLFLVLSNSRRQFLRPVISLLHFAFFFLLQIYLMFFIGPVFQRDKRKRGRFVTVSRKVQFYVRRFNRVVCIFEVFCSRKLITCF